VSPQAIKEEVKAYARDTGNELIHTLERKAREYPLQTVAVAAGLAYPAWRFLINIPAPVLLVGAGLALTQFGGSSRAPTSARRQSGGERQGEQLPDGLRQTAQNVSFNLSQAAEGLKEKVADAASGKKWRDRGLGAIRSRATQRSASHGSHVQPRYRDSGYRGFPPAYAAAAARRLAKVSSQSKEIS
jgi:hypothetical protein